ncbi:MAG: NAD(P)-dependent glycerol-3-phosphate dehydrogenase [Clostridia bacterium]|nr:NAD(P)-dependent glycerol-3-phosphate dehydrogenase [Clostridia bacterium]
MAKITVLGAGGWGIALALVANANKNDVTIWSAFKSEADALKTNRCNPKLLDGVMIPQEINITDDISSANGSDVVIMAVPSFAVRETAKKLKDINFGIIANASKGIESPSGKRMSEVILSCLPDANVVSLSGPTHAEEVARKIPTTIVAASKETEAAVLVQNALGNPYFRVYTNDDIIGAEIGGALKNVIAVAAGIIDGIGCGDNTKAALVTRGISEITRLGTAMGANESTFLGLTGIGDLVVTCTSPHSRNNRYGKLLGGGMDAKTALETVGTVEGYYAANAAMELSKKYSVELPICEQCYKIMYNGATPEKALELLMTRPFKNESEK